MSEATFKEVRINLEGRAGRLLVQDGLPTKIWLTAIHALRRHDNSKTAPEVRRAPRPMMADQNTKITLEPRHKNLFGYLGLVARVK